jgi:hypothetical protein
LGQQIQSSQFKKEKIMNTQANQKNRKPRCFIIVVCAIAALILVGCSDGNYVGLGKRLGSGTIVTEERTVGDFDSIYVRGEGTIYLTQGEEVSAVVETDDNIIDRVYTKVKDNTLDLSYASGPLGLNLRPTKGYIYHITVVDLAAITVKGSADVWADQVDADTVALEMIGSGQIVFDTLTADEASAEVTGEGQISLAGAAVTQHVTVTGSGIFNGQNFEGQHVDVRSKGSTQITVWATESLDVSLEGKGDVQYYGDVVPNFQVGSGEIQSLGNR